MTDNLIFENKVKQKNDNNSLIEENGKTIEKKEKDFLSDLLENKPIVKDDSTINDLFGSFLDFEKQIKKLHEYKSSITLSEFNKFIPLFKEINTDKMTFQQVEDNSNLRNLLFEEWQKRVNIYDIVNVVEDGNREKIIFQLPAVFNRIRSINESKQIFKDRLGTPLKPTDAIDVISNLNSNDQLSEHDVHYINNLFRNAIITSQNPDELKEDIDKSNEVVKELARIQLLQRRNEEMIKEDKIKSSNSDIKNKEEDLQDLEF